MGQTCSHPHQVNRPPVKPPGEVEANGDDPEIEQQQRDSLDDVFAEKETTTDSRKYLIQFSRFVLRGAFSNVESFVEVKWGNSLVFSTASMTSDTGHCAWDDSFSFVTSIPHTVLKQNPVKPNEQELNGDEDANQMVNYAASDDALNLTVICKMRKLSNRSDDFYEVGRITVNLYTVAHSPVHHDFALDGSHAEGAYLRRKARKLKNSNPPRLSYNCGIIERAVWQLSLLDVKVSYLLGQHVLEATRNEAIANPTSLPSLPSRSATETQEPLLHGVSDLQPYLLVYRISRNTIRDEQSELQFQAISHRYPRIYLSRPDSHLGLHNIHWTKELLPVMNVPGSFRELLTGTMRIQLFVFNSPSTTTANGSEEQVVAPTTPRGPPPTIPIGKANLPPLPSTSSSPSMMRSISAPEPGETPVASNTSSRSKSTESKNGSEDQVSVDTNSPAYQHRFPRYPTQTSMVFEKRTGSVFAVHSDTRLVGECWVPISRLFEEAQQHNSTSSTQTELVSEFRQELWLLGKRVGSLTGKFEFVNTPLAMQVASGVLSEVGITAASSVIVRLGSKTHHAHSLPQVREHTIHGVTVPTFGWKLMDKLRTNLFTSGLQQTLPPYGQDLYQAIHQLAKEMEKREYKGPAYTAAANARRLRLAKRVYYLLQISQKESMWSFVYDSDESLALMQRVFCVLWETTLQWMDAASYAVKIVFFEIVFSLLRRAELGELLQPQVQEMVYMSEFRAKHGPDKQFTDKRLVAKLEIAMECRGFFYRTLSYVLSRLNIKGSFDALRKFCARIVAVMCFRLPEFGEQVYSAIMPKNETTVEEWREAPNLKQSNTSNGSQFSIPEWRSTQFSLHEPDVASVIGPRYPPRSIARVAKPDKSTSQHQPATVEEDFEPVDSSPKQSHNRSSFAQSDTALAVLDWNAYHQVLEAEFSPEEIAKQQSVLPAPSLQWNEATNSSTSYHIWHQRLQKHGYLYFLICQEWIIYVLNAIGILASARAMRSQSDPSSISTAHLISWWRIPGYRRILKSFLLELRRRDLQDIPESMRKLSLLFLFESTLITPFVKIILFKTNAHDIASVGTSVDLISTWMTTIHSWGGRVQAEKVFRRFGPIVNASDARELLDEKIGLFTVPKPNKSDKAPLSLAQKFESWRSNKSSSKGNQAGGTKPTTKSSARNRSSSVSSISSLNASQLRPSLGFILEKEIEEDSFVTVLAAWTFDEVSIYMPQLDSQAGAAATSSTPMLDGIDEATDFAVSRGDQDPPWTRLLYERAPPTLPSTFDFKLLLQALWVLLHSDYFQVVLKAIEFMYQNWDMFPIHFQDDIRALLVSFLPDPFETEVQDKVNALHHERQIEKNLQGVRELKIQHMFSFNGSSSRRSSLSSQPDQSPETSPAASPSNTPPRSPLTSRPTTVPAGVDRDDADQVLDLSSASFDLRGLSAVGKAGKGSPLFIALFFHWSDEVRNFFQTCLWFRMMRKSCWYWKQKENLMKEWANYRNLSSRGMVCSPPPIGSFEAASDPRDPAFKHLFLQVGPNDNDTNAKLMAAVRVVEHSHTASLWEQVWAIQFEGKDASKETVATALLHGKRRHMFEVQLARSLNAALRSGEIEDSDSNEDKHKSLLIERELLNHIRNASPDQLTDADLSAFQDNALLSSRSTPTNSPSTIQRKRAGSNTQVGRKASSSSLSIRHVDSIGSILNKRIDEELSNSGRRRERRASLDNSTLKSSRSDPTTTDDTLLNSHERNQRSSSVHSVPNVELLNRISGGEISLDSRGTPVDLLPGDDEPALLPGGVASRSSNYVAFLKRQSSTDTRPVSLPMSGLGRFSASDTLHTEDTAVQQQRTLSNSSTMDIVLYNKEMLANDLKLIGLPHLPRHFQPYAALATAEFEEVKKRNDLPVLEWSAVVMVDHGEMRLVGSAGLLESDRAESKEW